MNKMDMIVNKEELTVRFEIEGDQWKWASNKLINSNRGIKIADMARSQVVKDFVYEMYFEKFIKQHKEYVRKVIFI